MKTFCTFLIAILSCIACAQKKDKSYTSPPGYDFAQPDVVHLPHVLREISGITFHPNHPTMLYAQQDEDGKLYYFEPTSSDLQSVEFAGSGDYEDLAMVKDHVILLRSDGTFFTFPFSNNYPPTVSSVKSEKILPKGEYESLAVGPDERLYVLCKQCSVDKKTDQTTGYILDLQADGTMRVADSFTIATPDITSVTKMKGKAFRPSALAFNWRDKKWYVLSSINKMLLITDTSWKPQAAYALDPKLFNQPEGMAFNQTNQLYISNEAGEEKQATLLKFNFHP